MTVERNSLRYFLPFPKKSSTLLTASSRAGKSSYLKFILEHNYLFFEDPIHHIIILHCSLHSDYYEFDFSHLESLSWPEPVVEQLPFNDFDFALLEPNSIVVVEDLIGVSQPIKHLVNVLTSHTPLMHCFLVTHSCLGSSHFDLLSLVHRIILFCACSAVSRLSNYIIRTFFGDEVVRSYLKRILNVSERSDDVLHLELNIVDSPTGQSGHLCCSSLKDYYDKGYCIVYPRLNKSHMYQDRTDEIQEAEVNDPSKLPAEDRLLDESFVILNANQVRLLRKQVNEVEDVESNHSDQDMFDDLESSVVGDSKQPVDVKKNKKAWDKLTTEIHKEVLGYLEPTKQFKGTSLLKQVLANDKILISEDGKSMKLKTKSNHVCIVDYILTALRPAGPNEHESKDYQGFREITQALLEHKQTPVSLFRNKMFLEKPSRTNKRKSQVSSNAGRRRRRRLDEEDRYPRSPYPSGAVYATPLPPPPLQPQHRSYSYNYASPYF